MSPRRSSSVWLDRIRDYESLTLMFHARSPSALSAAPRSKSYGRPSVLVQWLAEPQIMFDVPPRAFVPSPKVTSSVVRLRPRSRPLEPARQPDLVLERVTAAAFGQRRKMLRRASSLSASQSIVLLARAEVPPTARAEELSVPDHCAIARAFNDRQA